MIALNPEQTLELQRIKVARAKRLMRDGCDLKFAAAVVGLQSTQLDRLLWKSLGNPMRGAL